jgi:hypothetical protein
MEEELVTGDLDYDTELMSALRDTKILNLDGEEVSVQNILRRGMAASGFGRRPEPHLICEAAQAVQKACTDAAAE